MLAVESYKSEYHKIDEPSVPGGDGRLLRHDETAATSGVAVPRVGVVVVRVAGGRVAAVLAPALLGEVDAVVHRVPAPVVLALPAVHVVRADDQVARGAVLVDAGVPDGDPTQGGGLRRGTDPEGQSHGRERARDEKRKLLPHRILRSNSWRVTRAYIK